MAPQKNFHKLARRILPLPESAVRSDEITDNAGSGTKFGASLILLTIVQNFSNILIRDTTREPVVAYFE